MSILKILEAQLKPLVDGGKITIMNMTEVIEILKQPDGAVIGVVAKDGKGNVAKHLAHNVALTCGGYTYNSEMYQSLEGAKDYTQSTYPYSQGAGIKLGIAAGGYVRGGQYHTPLFGAVLNDNEYPSLIRAMVRHFPGDRPPWEIFVNASGQRFVCEDVLSHNAYEQGLRAQPDERCWCVFDDAIFKAAPPIARGGLAGPWTHEDTIEAFATGVKMFSRANTIKDLAAAAGVDAEGLAKTVTAYNAAQAGGTDSLGRKYMPLPISKPPYYAIQLQSWNLTGYAGLAVDGRLNVIRQDGAPIPNLYAAGELLGMGQLMGQSVCGGMSVTPALTLGRLLGHEILNFKS